MDNELEKIPSGIMLPFDRKQFSDFISSLLGKPQTISKRFGGYFSLEKNDILNIDKLINQRILQQNKGKLVNFRATIYYSDNSTTELNGIHHLIDYNETLPLVSEAVHLNWKFLVQFEDKDIPEMQEITLSFVSESESPRKYDFQEDEYPSFVFAANGINLRINHTARTWGSDLEGLVSKHLETIITKRSKLSLFLKLNHEEVSNYITYIVILFTISLTFYRINSGDLNTHEYTSKSILMVFGLYIFGKLMGQLIGDVLGLNWKQSYILLTKESEKNKKRKEKAYFISFCKYTIGIFIQLIISIGSSYIFLFLQ